MQPFTLQTLAAAYRLPQQPSWQALQRHLALTQRADVLFLITPDASGATVCRYALEQTPPLGASLLYLQPDVPNDPATLATCLMSLPTLVAPGLIWIQIPDDVPHESLPDAQAAWDRAFTALNPHRNPILQSLPAPLIFAGPPWLFQSFRSHAPDWFSIRSGVFDLAGDIAHVASTELGQPNSKRQAEWRQSAPSPSPKPPTQMGQQLVNNLPYTSLGTMFKGRVQVMRSLRETFTDAIPRVALIHSLGGMGKTRIAIEYAWQYAHEYDSVLFISAPTREQLKTGIAALTGPLALNLPEQNATEQQVQYAAALRWLHQHSRWFLILDGVDSEDARNAVVSLLPYLNQGHVCITSRHSQWPCNIKSIELLGLSEEAGAAFLLERTADRRTATADDLNLARLLAARLGGLSLALEMAAAHISLDHLNFQQYLELFEASEQQASALYGVIQLGEPKSVEKIWLTTFQQLSNDERELLQTLSWFDTQPIPLWLVEPEEDVNATHGGDLELHLTRAVLAALAKWHLVTFSDDGQSIKVHRLVQEITLSLLIQAEPRARSLARALSWLDQAKLGPPDDVRNWPRWDAVQSHILHLAKCADQAQQWIPAVRWRNRVARLLEARARFSDAEILFREALSISQQHLPEEHNDAVALINNLAGLLYATNRMKEAEPLFRQALILAERSYGPEHPNVAACLNNLAELLQATNRLMEAESLYRRALTIDEKSYGPQHPFVATCLNNLAGLLRASNRLAEAEPLYRRALLIDQQIYGPEHPFVATDLNNLAGLLWATNRFAEAETMHRTALSIDESCYGPQHPSVATDLNNLAMLLATTDQQEDAEQMLRRALAIDENSYGPQHPSVARDLLNFAALLHESGRSEEALPLIQRAIAIYRRSGEDQGYVHPRLAAAQRHLETIQHVVE